MRFPKWGVGLAIVGALLIAQDMALAVTYNVPITLQTTGVYNNEVTMTLNGEAGNPGTSVATGDYTVQLDVSFDASDVATINSIRFVSSAGVPVADKPGHISLGSMSFWGGAVTFENMYGTFNSPNNAVAVAGGAFDVTATSGSRVIINDGIIDATALGAPLYNLATDWPIDQAISNGAGATGTISVSSPYLSGDVNTYDVSVVVPVLFSQDLKEGVPAAVSGTLYGVGSFSAVPEPGTVAMLLAGGLALLGWAGLRRR